jgi:hypothetical protein
VLPIFGQQFVQRPGAARRPRLRQVVVHAVRQDTKCTAVDAPGIKALPQRWCKAIRGLDREAPRVGLIVEPLAGG